MLLNQYFSVRVVFFPHTVYRWIENDVIFNNLIWRNTKESIAEENSVPDYAEELVYVDFCPVEALLHARKTGQIYVNDP